MLGAAREQVKPFARALAAPFVWLRVPPTALTLFSVVPAVAGAYVVALGWWLPALGLGLVAGFLDMVDGTVARVRDRVTAFGGYIDSVMDRVVDLAFLFGLGFALDTAWGWLLVGLAALGGYGTSYAKARLYEQGAPPSGSWNQLFERPERLIVIGLGVLAQGLLDLADRDPDHYTMLGFLAVLAVGSLFTFGQRVLVARRVLRPGPLP